MKVNKRLVGWITGAVLVITLPGVALSACSSSDADVASHNLSKDADNFKINRRIVFYNGITGEYMLVIEGFCSLGNDDKPKELSVTCKVGSGFKKDFLGLSDNISYFLEQIDSAGVSTDHYKVVWKPSTVVPGIEVR